MGGGEFTYTTLTDIPVQTYINAYTIHTPVYSHISAHINIPHTHTHA